MKKISLSLAIASAAFCSSLASANEHPSHAYNQENMPEYLRLPQLGLNPLQLDQVEAQDEITRVHWPVNDANVSSSLRNVDSAAAAICLTPVQLAAVSGQQRIDLLETNRDYACFENNMWGVADDLKASLFDQATMVAVAQRAQVLATQYDGTDNNGLRNFINYLRVGLWAVANNRGANLTSAMQNFLDALVANPSYFNTDSVNAFNVKEAMILMYVESWRSRYIQAGIGWLQRYDANWGSDMQRLLTKTLTLFFRGGTDSAFKVAVEKDRALVTALSNFLVNNENLIGHKNEYQYNDAASELARLLGVGGQTYQQTKVLVRDFLTSNSMTGNHRKAWFNMVAQVDYHDGGNCNYYNTCNYKQTLEATVLPISYSCSSTLRVRAQELTNEQLVGICRDLAKQETYFHNKLDTGNVPVADDFNSTLELVIYNNSADYKFYSAILFNHSTDNGGIYLEGNPSVQGNIPRFMAHEAEWLPEFTVWNLEHEYVHYLDGRFNKKGNYKDGESHNTVWWGEGLAEYISKKNRNDKAIVQARKNTYNLSELFKTKYKVHDSTRIYDWGYLAIRYMFEQHSADINGMLIELRDGDYVGFDNYLANLGTQYNSGFTSWLQTVESSDDNGNDQSGSLKNNQTVTVNSNGTELPAYFVDIPTGATNLVIQTRDGTSGDADLHVKFGREATRTDYDYRPWKAGSNETVSIAAPQAGRWHIMVSPYSNQAMTEVKLTASWTETGGDNGSTTIDNVCTAQNPVSSGKLTPDNTICLDGSRTVYLSIWVPTGKSTLTLIGGHGTGDMTLYHKAGAWPSASSYDNLSTASGSNNDSITITNPSSGWHYLMVTGQHSGAALLTKFN